MRNLRVKTSDRCSEDVELFSVLIQIVKAAFVALQNACMHGPGIFHVL